MSSLRISTSCFGCITSASRPLLASSRPVVASVSSTFSPTQTRGKKTKKPDQRVVVRLLQDITQYGRRDTIMRIERGRMRNFWYPNGMAEYMTSARIQELALPLDEAISHREPWFVAAKDGIEGEEPEAPIAAATPKRTVSIKTLTVSSPMCSRLYVPLLAHLLTCSLGRPCCYPHRDHSPSHPCLLPETHLERNNGHFRLRLGRRRGQYCPRGPAKQPGRGGCSGAH